MFQDRQEGGRRLAELLSRLPLRSPVVLGIPRGGVVTAAVVAKEIGAELDVVISRKLRHPRQEELSVGALAEDGQVVFNDFAREGVASATMQEEVRRRKVDLDRYLELFRAVRPAAEIRGRTAIVVDDGIATGSTMIAALKCVRARSPCELIAAAPVAHPARLEEVGRHCDRTVCVRTDADFEAVGRFYEDFRQVSDREACRILAEFAPRTPSRGGDAGRHDRSGDRRGV